jgi:hypothetical protein
MPGKSLPITKRDQARLIHIMAETPAWTGYRRGRKIALSHRYVLTGHKIEWTLFVYRHRISGVEDTVADACLALNAEILNSFDRRRRLAS